MSQPILNVDKLSFSRGPREILSDVSFEVRAGDFTSIVGKNGAGKTTLLKCLCRILKVNSGSIQVLSRELTSYTQKELARHLSYLPQSDHRVPPFSVWEYVTMGRYPHLSPFASVSQDDKRAVEEAMARVGVTHLAKRNLENLSGGERQKVLIGACLAQGAEILLLDEPCSFLDPKHQVEVFETLNQLNHEGVTVVMVSHDLNGTARYAKSVIAMKNGRIAFTGDRADFITAATLESVFDVPFDVIPRPNSDRSFVLPVGKS